VKIKEQQLNTSKPDVHPIGSEPIVVKEGWVGVKIYGTWHKQRRLIPAQGKLLNAIFRNPDDYSNFDFFPHGDWATAAFTV